jgi:hypothetical protein
MGGFPNECANGGLGLLILLVLWSLFWLVMGFALGGSFVSLFGTPINLVLTAPLLIALAVCILSLVVLGSFVALVWSNCLRRKISDNCFRTSRICLTVLAVIYAVYCVLRLTCNVAIPRKLSPEFLPELIFYSIFWVLAPPIWFFAEYLAVKSKCISGFPPTDKNLKEIKDYADYASKIWAGVLALFAALIALKQ